MWIDTVRACGASSRTARRTLSSTASYSSRSSLISKCSSTDTDQGYVNGDEIEGYVCLFLFMYYSIDLTFLFVLLKYLYVSTICFNIIYIMCMKSITV